MKKESNPLISIVIPVYNGEHFLEQCINSIINQSYNNIEIIIIDDGSEDKTKNVVMNFLQKDERIKYYYQVNSGVSSARNVGIEKAKGEFITFVDADDYLSKEYITYFYNMITKNDADIALTPMPRKFNSNSKELDESNCEDVQKIVTGEEATIAMLYYNIAIGPWNKLISMKLIREYSLRFNPKLCFGEGFNFSIDCFQRANKVIVGTKRLYNYRLDNTNSVMTKFSLKLVTGSIEAQESIKKNLVNRNKRILKACRYSNWHTHCDCLNTMIGCNVVKENKELYNNIKKVCKRDAISIVGAPIPKKDKIKGIIYSISPFLTAKIINHFRLRKFTVKNNNEKIEKGH